MTECAGQKRPAFKRHGSFTRKSDGLCVARFVCRRCRRTFSEATRDPCVRQLKRHVNEPLRELLGSSVSMRNCARFLRVNRKTVARKLVFLGAQAEAWLNESNASHMPAAAIQFDDVETYEHTKLKPLSIAIAVVEKERRILGVKVARMPANGPLASLSRKKYGKRPDRRKRARRALFKSMKPLVAENATIKTDESSHYGADIKELFPACEHLRFKGRRGCVTGQGELKKIGFDPIFSLNHTAAMLRYSMSRLVRKTWCGTKRPDRLQAHLYVYAQRHNQSLKTAKPR